MPKEYAGKLKRWRIQRERIIAAAKKYSMAEVGRMFDISRQRVRQIVQAAK